MKNFENSALRYATLKTNVGEMLAVASDRGLCALRFCDDKSLTRELRTLREEMGSAIEEDRAGMKTLLEQVRSALSGTIPAAEVPLDPAGTTFQKRVWRELVKVPWGKTVSYTELARKAGNPKAVRAAASACANNPITFLIPCHRVLRKDGSLGGYFWGLDKKQSLLERERKD